MNIYYLCNNIYYDVDNKCMCCLVNGRWVKATLDEIPKEKQKETEEKIYSARVRKHANAMLHELKHCRVNHPDNSWPWKSFDFVHQCSIMMEEAGEAVRAANTLRESSKGDLLSLYNELAQTGAMCLRIMEQLREYSRRDKSSN